MASSFNLSHSILVAVKDVDKLFSYFGSSNKLHAIYYASNLMKQKWQKIQIIK